jgi:hypothetical protein
MLAERSAARQFDEHYCAMREVPSPEAMSAIVDNCVMDIAKPVPTGIRAPAARNDMAKTMNRLRNHIFIALHPARPRFECGDAAGKTRSATK